MVPRGSGGVARIERWGDALIASSVLLAYWPLTTLRYSISAGDTLDCWLPWRTFLSRCLRNGELPVWNPYQQMGYPVHADLQGPAWYVEALALGGTVGHGAVLLQWLFLGYVVVAGLGMRRFIDRSLGPSGPWSVLGGVAFALSGFFTGHAQHFYSIISGAWFPWLLWAMLGLLDRPNWRNALCAAVFQSLLLTGGNHTFTLIGTYLLLGLIVLRVFQLSRGDEGFLPLFASLALFVGVSVTMSIGTFHAWWEVRPYLARVEGLSLEQAASMPFPWKAWATQYLPSLATADPAFLGSDPTMVNGYWGMLLIPFLGIGSLVVRKSRVLLLAGFGALCAVASLGDATPVHAALWRWVPGLDLFRFPGYYWYFTLLAGIPVAVLGIRHVSRLWSEHRRRVQLVVVLSAGGLLLGLAHVHALDPASSATQVALYKTYQGLSIPVRALLDLLPLLFLVIGTTFRRQLRLTFHHVLFSSVWLSSLFAVQATQWHTTLGPHHPLAIQARIDAMPAVPFVPVIEPLGESRDGSRHMHWLWRNTQLFMGRPSYDGFNSFQLKGYQHLLDHDPDRHQLLLREPLVFLTDDVQRKGAAFQTGHLVPSDTPLPGRMQGSPDDTVRLTSFSYTSVGMHCRTDDHMLLVVQQAAYPGWRMFVDHQVVDPILVDQAALGVLVPPGEHMVQAEFHKPLLPVLYWIGLGSFLLVLTLLAITARQGRRARSLATAGLAGLLAYSMLGHSTARDDRLEHEELLAPKLAAYPDADVIWNGDLVPDRSRIGSRNVEHVKLPWPDDLSELGMARVEELGDTILLVSEGLPWSASLDVFFSERFPVVLDHLTRDHFRVEVRKRANSERKWVPMPQEAAVLDSASPYLAAAEIRLAELGTKERTLVVTAEVLLDAQAEGIVVIERRRGEELVDFEGVPLWRYPQRGEQWRPVVVVRSLTRAADDELVRVYLWQQGGGRMAVRNARYCLQREVPLTP
ncbi:MAG: hypothetical protein KDB88_01615 [Flavobacteriales bacterium]|nr:hypothetical protein [Flavobacteriales bacterium]